MGVLGIPASRHPNRVAEPQNARSGGAGRAFLPGITRRPGGAKNSRNKRAGGKVAWAPPKRAPRRRGGAASASAQAPKRTLGDERIRRHLEASSVSPALSVMPASGIGRLGESGTSPNWRAAPLLRYGRSLRGPRECPGFMMFYSEYGTPLFRSVGPEATWRICFRNTITHLLGARSVFPGNFLLGPYRETFF